jgi:three-Cys-motif partner protein
MRCLSEALWCMPKIDFAAYEGGREQAYIKHTLLEEYLPEWGYKVGSQWDSLVYVDGFAGPWDVQTPSFDDSSFGIASKALNNVASGLTEHGRQLNVRCVLVEQSPEAFKKLKAYADSVNRPGFRVDALSGQFVSQLPAIQKIIHEAGSSAFRFVFLDPKGWADIPMSEIRPLLNVRGSEVVVNLMTRFMIRFLEQPDRAESFKGLFGRDEVLPILDATPAAEKHDALVREYGKSLHQLCGFKYVSSAIILEPKRDDIRYFLVYGTNHHRGVEVFKAAETKAARLQDQIRHESAVQKSGGQNDMMGALFGGEVPKSDYGFTLWQRYCEKAKRKLIDRILAAPAQGVSFAELFCDAMAFPLVTPTDLHGWITRWQGAIELNLDGEKRKKPSPDHEDRIILKDSERLRGFLRT